MRGLVAVNQLSPRTTLHDARLFGVIGQLYTTMSNPLATLLHNSIAVLDAAGVAFLPEQRLELKGKPEDLIKATEAARTEQSRLGNLKVEDDKREEHEEAYRIATEGMKGVKLVTRRQRINKFVSDACSSRDGAEIVTKMALRKVSFTVARAEARVNDKATQASQPFAAAVSLINVAEALIALHSVCNTGWTMPVSPSGNKPRKFGFATATVTKTPVLTDETIAAERAAQ